MNETVILSTAAQEDAWTLASLRACAWRGASMQCFAKAEMAVTETLVALREVPDRGTGIKVPHLIGQKFELLGRIVGAEGLFAREGGDVAKALAALHEHNGLRTQLGHSVAKVTIDRTGRWTIVWRSYVVRAGKGEQTIAVIEEEEAGKALLHLRRKSQSLCALLRNLCEAVA